MTLYRPYKTEVAICEKLNELAKQPQTFKNTDDELHKDEGVQPDIKIADSALTIECKTAGTNSSKHYADITAWHTGISNKTSTSSVPINFYLTAKDNKVKEAFLAYFESPKKERIPIKSRTSPKALESTLGCDVTFPASPETILTCLNNIEERLKNYKTEDYKTDELVAKLNKHIGDAERLAKDLTKDLTDPPDAEVNIDVEDNTTLDKAKDDLAKVTKYILDNVK